MRLLVLVNSERESTDGRRAREICSRLSASVEVKILYRGYHGRMASIVSFIREGLGYRPDVVYVELFAYSGLLAGLALKGLAGAKLGVGNGDHAFGTHWKAGRPVKAVLSAALDAVLRRTADFWAVWSPFYASWLRTRGVRNVVCVPGAVDPGKFARRDVSALRSELGLDGGLIVGVAGHLQYCRKLDMVYGWDLVEALAQLRDVDVRGVVVGGGSGAARLEAMARERGVLDRLRLVGPVPHARIPEYLSLFDVGLITLSNDLDARFTWTAKLPEYMAAGAFVITSDVGDRSRSFVRRCGTILPFFGGKDEAYPSRVAKTIRELMADPHALGRRTCGPRIASQLLSYAVAGRHFERALAGAVRRG